MVHAGYLARPTVYGGQFSTDRSMEYKYSLISQFYLLVTLNR